MWKRRDILVCVLVVNVMLDSPGMKRVSKAVTGNL